MFVCLFGSLAMDVWLGGEKGRTGGNTHTITETETETETEKERELLVC